MGKQMEGDNRQRRKKANEARHEHGVPASRSQVTLGASKPREHLPGKADHEERITSPRRGKQRSDVDAGPKRR
ncbi:hypothetical protein [Prauserella muralis]|uniref:Uncharacterized protein n=1 Tax=Prauserella muralis TaxID=588067 RepID=A0A2V4APM9_9PSEU|nr:hypothetical protein [Prauserella muralis]PXY22663.1 hypothetical protein BAY60_22860 [Prauserella muralis]TWE28373.1 hypothetical protein FHX69_1028 [Prauserella muralis]